MGHQRVDQRHRCAGHAKAANHDRVTIFDGGNGLRHGGGFIGQFHGAPTTGRPVSAANASSASRKMAISSSIWGAVMISGGATRK